MMLTNCLSESPEWIEEPVDVEASPGKEVRLDCKASGFPQPIVEWTSLHSQQNLVRVEGGTLIIPQVSQSNAGRYQCRISNGVGKELIKTITVRVRGMIRSLKAPHVSLIILLLCVGLSF